MSTQVTTPKYTIVNSSGVPVTVTIYVKTSQGQKPDKIFLGPRDRATGIESTSTPTCSNSKVTITKE